MCLAAGQQDRKKTARRACPWQGFAPTADIRCLTYFTMTVAFMLGCILQMIAYVPALGKGTAFSAP